MTRSPPHWAGRILERFYKVKSAAVFPAEAQAQPSLASAERVNHGVGDQQYIGIQSDLAHRLRFAVKAAFAEQGPPLRNAAAVLPSQGMSAQQQEDLVDPSAAVETPASGGIAHAQQQQTPRRQRGA